MDEAVFPNNAEFFVAMGAALLSKKEVPMDFGKVAARWHKPPKAGEINSLPSLFKDLDE